MNGASSSKTYVKELRETFFNSRSSANAVQMQAYMKNIAPFFGIKTPLRRQLNKTFISTHGLPANADEVALLLWNEPERELHYFAMELLGKLTRQAPENRLAVYETLILNKSWWDTVDYISPHLCGKHLRSYPHLRDATITRWLSSNNLWLKRSTLLFQLSYKKETDQQLLFSVCQQLAGEPDFFIRKAIGWALRQYARTAPHAVKEFVLKTDLSPLSRKEALKHF